jgi:hypothetical protein
MRRLFLLFSCCIACTAESPELAARNGRKQGRDADLPYGRPDPAAGIARSWFSIEGVVEGQGEDEVRRTLGPPANASDPQETDGHSYTHWSYPGLSVGFDRHQVLSVECSAPSPCRTADGVGLGATHEAVQRAYGSGFRGFARGNDALIYYALGRPDCALIFDFTSGALARSTFSCGLSVPDLDHR